MKSLHKNALALACINSVLSEFKEKPADYIEDYDSRITKRVFNEMDSWENSQKFTRDLKNLANEYYRRIKK